jgi:hypothetical protein
LSSPCYWCATQDGARRSYRMRPSRRGQLFDKERIRRLYLARHAGDPGRAWEVMRRRGATCSQPRRGDNATPTSSGRRCLRTTGNEKKWLLRRPLRKSYVQKWAEWPGGPKVARSCAKKLPLLRSLQLLHLERWTRGPKADYGPHEPALPGSSFAISPLIGFAATSITMLYGWSFGLGPLPRMEGRG